MAKWRELKEMEDLTDEPRKYTLSDWLNPSTLKEIIHDEYMEPHVHLAMLLVILFIVAIIVGIIEYAT